MNSIIRSICASSIGLPKESDATPARRRIGVMPSGIDQCPSAHLRDRVGENREQRGTIELVELRRRLG